LPASRALSRGNSARRPASRDCSHRRAGATKPARCSLPSTIGSPMVSTESVLWRTVFVSAVGCVGSMMRMLARGSEEEVMKWRIRRHHTRVAVLAPGSPRPACSTPMTIPCTSVCNRKIIPALVGVSAARSRALPWRANRAAKQGRKRTPEALMAAKISACEFGHAG
jgi:hypothetical protein